MKHELCKDEIFDNVIDLDSQFILSPSYFILCDANETALMPVEI
jgi:hypothetical protein